MKTFNYKIITFIVLIFVSLCAQGQAINTLSILPANPTPEDSVKVIANVWLPSGSCWLQIAGISAIGQDINVIAGYDAGMLTYICTSIDTVTLGRFGPGTYNCNYNLVFPFYTSAIDDMMSISFTVSGAVSVFDLDENQSLLSLMDDPQGGYCLKYKLPYGDAGQQVLVYDMLGRLQFSKSLTFSTEASILLPMNGAGGSFLVSVIGKSGHRYSKIFISPQR